MVWVIIGLLASFVFFGLFVCAFLKENNLDAKLAGICCFLLGVIGVIVCSGVLYGWNIGVIANSPSCLESGLVYRVLSRTEISGARYIYNLQDAANDNSLHSVISNSIISSQFVKIDYDARHLLPTQDKPINQIDRTIPEMDAEKSVLEKPTAEKAKKTNK